MANTEGRFDRQYHEAVTFWSTMHGATFTVMDMLEDLNGALFDSCQERVWDVVILLHTETHLHLDELGAGHYVPCDKPHMTVDEFRAAVERATEYHDRRPRRHQ